MSIIKRNHNLPGMFSLFDDLFSRDLMNWGLENNSETNTTIPAANIKETNENYEVEIAAPGMSKDDFRIELEGNKLTISSEKTNEWKDSENERYTQREFSYQSFQRTFNLAKEVVDIEKIEARYQNGILKLLIPKKEEARQKPPRLIQIS
ncbi:MAG: Hsp20/alpha crystallin family protein [Flavisolibacter sp.]